MTSNYTKDQFWQLYRKLPPELKEIISCEETSDNIYEICERYELLDFLYGITEIVGQVLLGVLNPKEFQSTIEKVLSLNPNVAKKISQEINRFIFYPARMALGEIYDMEFSPVVKEKEPLPIQKTPPKHLGEDSYREDFS